MIHVGVVVFFIVNHLIIINAGFQLMDFMDGNKGSHPLIIVFLSINFCLSLRWPTNLWGLCMIAPTHLNLVLLPVHQLKFIIRPQPPLLHCHYHRHVLKVIDTNPVPGFQ